MFIWGGVAEEVSPSAFDRASVARAYEHRAGSGGSCGPVVRSRRRPHHYGLEMPCGPGVRPVVEAVPVDTPRFVLVIKY